MEWISVKDRLPEKYQKVLFYVLERKEIYSGYYVQDAYRDIQSTYKFREMFDDWWFEGETVTHWMPLPTPPKE